MAAFVGGATADPGPKFAGPFFFRLLGHCLDFHYYFPLEIRDSLSIFYLLIELVIQGSRYLPRENHQMTAMREAPLVRQSSWPTVVRQRAHNFEVRLCLIGSTATTRSPR